MQRNATTPPDQAGRDRAHATIRATASRPTPVLVVREEPLLRNLARMQALCDTRGVRLRPHVKTHKSTMIAAMQRSRGTVGITVASLAEAEVFARAGHDDILAVFPPVDPVKRARFESLARTTHLTFAVDDISGVAAVESLADRTGSPVGYVWETETGTARGGTSPQDTVRSLAAARAAHPRARFAGLMSFGGHVYGAASPAAVIEEARRDSETIAETAARAAAAGIIVPHVSVGATPGAADLLSNRGVTELRAGNYVFNDATQVALGAAQVGDCAQVIVTTVTSRPAPQRALIDAGSKGLPKEVMSGLTSGFGIVEGHPDLTITRLYEEVGVIEGPSTALDEIGAGERLSLIPNHSCTSTVLYPAFVMLRADGTTETFTIDARDH